MGRIVIALLIGLALGIWIHGWAFLLGVVVAFLLGAIFLY